MIIDKKLLNSMLALPDEKLFSMISVAASSVGAAPPKKCPDAATMSGLRRLLAELTDDDIARAGELLALYRAGAAGR